MADEKPERREVTRLSFIKASAGAATGAAAIGVPAGAILSDGKAKVVTAPTSQVPHEPVTAFVRDAKRGEVTVLAGTGETTYRDPALVKRLLAAAPQVTTEGGTDVLAP